MSPWVAWLIAGVVGGTADALTGTDYLAKWSAWATIGAFVLGISWSFLVSRSVPFSAPTRPLGKS
jgi:hypothetical protein